MGNETNKKGFEGLSDLKSDVDSILNEPVYLHEESNKGRMGEIADLMDDKFPKRGSNNDSDRVIHPNQKKDPDKFFPVWWWIGGGILLFMAIGINMHEPVTTETAPMATEEVVPAAEAYTEEVAPAAIEEVAPVVEAYSPQEEFYIRPSEGRDNVLSIPEIRYCIANGIKIDAIRTRLDSSNSTKNSQIDRLNVIVKEHNARCGSYQYRIGDDTTAASQVEQESQNIKQAALNDFF